jgi:hypothetical protein
MYSSTIFIGNDKPQTKSHDNTMRNIFLVFLACRITLGAQQPGVSDRNTQVSDRKPEHHGVSDTNTQVSDRKHEHPGVADRSTKGSKCC